MKRPKSFVNDKPSVWLVEREFIFERRFVPVAVLPSATKKDAEIKRDALETPYLFRVSEYQRVSPRPKRGGKK